MKEFVFLGLQSLELFQCAIESFEFDEEILIFRRGFTVLEFSVQRLASFMYGLNSAAVQATTYFSKLYCNLLNELPNRDEVPYRKTKRSGYSRRSGCGGSF